MVTETYLTLTKAVLVLVQIQYKIAQRDEKHFPRTFTKWC